MNLMTHITSRAGKVLLRVGGNTQEKATVVPSGLPKDAAIQKVQEGTGTVSNDRFVSGCKSYHLLSVVSVSLPI